MRSARRTSKLLIEPPTSATGDIAFNLIVFFLVCASIQPDSGRQQDIPRSEENQQQKEEAKNIEIAITSNLNAVSINGDTIRSSELTSKLSAMMKGKTRPEDRIVIVKSKTDTPYHHWIDITGAIEQSGGLVTIQREEEQTIQVD
ncbi:Biopolymer transport protein ExbD/TolR [Novipirellula galeiformis]|uniref:Biopolymer transport protein ExbD/TolR n=1 Tax=Novipirellula galeiformis TaxID=2528004 RepID=A0A5C6CUC0_9BACT|nr:biopolymer transporter ExbD [Novipirellula galeiformis]TWU26636.1 Biopolymer transport protein ExbD/TolR [Novipirellula galeiformis]